MLEIKADLPCLLVPASFMIDGTHLHREDFYDYLEFLKKLVKKHGIKGKMSITHWVRDRGAFEYTAEKVEFGIAADRLRSSLPGLSNPWQPKAGYEIINLAGKRMQRKKLSNGIYLIRRQGTGIWHCVTVLDKKNDHTAKNQSKMN